MIFLLALVGLEASDFVETQQKSQGLGLNIHDCIFVPKLTLTLTLTLVIFLLSRATFTM